ncbi:MAG: dockerin type I domain-containing protein [Armatimonadota bacterium]
MRKRALYLLLVLTCILGTPAESQVNGVLSVRSASGAPGEIVGIEILIDANVRGVASAQFILDFSRASSIKAPQLQPVLVQPGTQEAKIQLGPMVPSGVVATASARSGGQVMVGIAGVTGFSGPGVMVVIPLQIPTNAVPRTSYELQLRDVLLYDESGRQISVTLKNGTLTIAGLMDGDVTGDGVVDIRDALLALKMALGLALYTTDQLAAADLNKDGRITVVDVQAILRLALGLPPLFIPEEAYRKAIIDSYARLEQAIERKDLLTVMSMVSRDYLHNGVNREGFQAAFANYFDTHYDINVSFRVTSVEFERIEGQDVAFVTFDQYLSGRRTSDGRLEEEQSQSSKMVWILENGIWKMIGNQETERPMSRKPSGPSTTQLLG